jgi:hypothetical protein
VGLGSDFFLIKKNNFASDFDSSFTVTDVGSRLANGSGRTGIGA